MAKLKVSRKVIKCKTLETYKNSGIVKDFVNLL